MAELYTITQQQEVVDTTDVTAPVRAMKITFRSAANGTLGTVTLPLIDYTAEKVDAAIKEYVARIDAVHEL